MSWEEEIEKRDKIQALVNAIEGLKGTHVPIVIHKPLIIVAGWAKDEIR